jgi:hypothetical protein
MIVIFFFFEETRFYRRPTEEPIEPPTDQKHEVLVTEASTIPRKSLLQRLNPWSGIHPTTSYLAFFIRPWPMLAYPAVLYSFLTFSASVSWSICLLDTSAAVFQEPPYNMTPGINSLIYIATIIGMSIGAWVGGPLTDILAVRYARRHNGVFEPEVRLVVMLAPFFLVPVGLLMYFLRLLIPSSPSKSPPPSAADGRYGVGIANQTHWIVPWIGGGIILFGNASIPTITLTYRTIPRFPPDCSRRLLLPRRR